MTPPPVFALTFFTDNRLLGLGVDQSFFPTSLLANAVVNKKIMLLRNDSRERRALSLLLVDAGFFVASFANPQEALAVAKHEEFDLIVSDYQGTDEAGFGFVKAIKESQPWMPVMVISSDLEMDQVIEALRLKVKDLFIPPFEPNDFLEAVVKVLCPEKEISNPEYSDQDMAEMSSLLMGNFSLEGNGNRRPPVKKDNSKSSGSSTDRLKGPPASPEPNQNGAGNEELNKVIEDLKHQLSVKEEAVSEEEATWLEKKEALKERVKKLEEESEILKENLAEENEKRMTAVAEERASIIEREREIETKRENLESQLDELKSNGSIQETALIDEASKLRKELKEKEAKLEEKNQDLERLQNELEVNQTNLEALKEEKEQQTANQSKAQAEGLQLDERQSELKSQEEELKALRKRLEQGQEALGNEKSTWEQVEANQKIILQQQKEKLDQQKSELTGELQALDEAKAEIAEREAELSSGEKSLSKERTEWKRPISC